ncbi:50S ribosomal protein L23 [uncultured archaeon]|nr:50S ribosomal protein L23 [uncultured archaeon]
MVKLKEEEKIQLKSEQEAKEAPKEIKSKSEKNKEAKDKAAKTVMSKTATLHDLDVVLYPLVTEKAVNMIESENKITFVVNDTSGKAEVKKAVEEAYGVKVVKINIIRDMKGRKKAIVKLDKKNKASELATKLGVL